MSHNLIMMSYVNNSMDVHKEWISIEDDVDAMVQDLGTLRETLTGLKSYGELALKTVEQYELDFETEKRGTEPVKRTQIELMEDLGDNLQMVKERATMVGNTTTISSAAEWAANISSKTTQEVKKIAIDRMKPGLNWTETVALYMMNEKTFLIWMPLVMFLVIVAFTALGAGIFISIEGPHEEVEKTEIAMERNLLLEGIYEDFSIKNNTDWLAAAESQIKEYEKKLYESFQHGVSSDTDVRVWTFWKAMFFCSTITTSIGYGHITPVTSIGQLFTIFVALIGIPLMLVLLADLGKLLTMILKDFFKFRDTNKNSSLRQWCIAFLKFVVSWFCFWRKSNTDGSPDEEAASAVEKENVTQKKPIEEDKFSLFLWALLILVIYIVIGCCIFTLWENWSFYKAFYFIIISITTVGFGDVVPEHPGFMMAVTLYLIFGLAVFSMIINIVQENLSSSIVVVTKQLRKQYCQIIKEAVKEKEESKNEGNEGKVRSEETKKKE